MVAKLTNSVYSKILILQGFKNAIVCILQRMNSAHFLNFVYHFLWEVAEPQGSQMPLNTFPPYWNITPL